MLELEYSRPTRSWQLVEAGEAVAVFPAGAEGRAAAQLAQIETESDELAEWVRHFEAYHEGRDCGRYRRAALLVVGGHVRPVAAGGGPGFGPHARHWRVVSSTGQKTYDVRLGESGTFDATCTCPDPGFQYTLGSGRTCSPRCKHILAVAAARNYWSSLPLANVQRIQERIAANGKNR
jgi:hypothetical protein